MKKIIYIFIIIFTAHQQCFAQPPYSACFTLDVVPPYGIKGCAPLTVRAISCSGNPSVQYDFGDGTPLTYNPVHTYSAVGNYKILQLVNTLGGIGYPPSDTISKRVNVMPLPAPDFNISVCKNFAVTVNTLDNIYDKYVIDWGDGSPKDSITGNSAISHTTTLGTKTVQVKGIYLSGPNCSSQNISTQVIPIQNPAKPDILNLIVDKQANGNGQITLNLNSIKGQKYYLQQSTGSNTAYTTIANIPKDTIDKLFSITVNNLNTLSTQYCFRFKSYDDCAHDSTSEEICSNIIGVTPQSDLNIVKWSSPFIGSFFAKYTLYGGSSGTISPAISPYQDNNIVCNSNYCYLLVTDLTKLTAAGNPIQSITDDSCVIAISSIIPPPIQNLNSTVTGNLVNLTWDVPVFVPAAAQYRILRSANGGAYLPYSTANTNNYTDNVVNVNSDQYCYLVDYTPCTVTSSPGLSTCTSYLQGNETGGINLNWSPYTCTSGSAVYTVERLDPNTNAVISSISVTSLTFTDASADPNAPILKYRIKIDCGGTFYYSNIFEINHEIKIFLPNAFTPDGDGNNDIFVAKGNYVKDFKMTIFNRWGEIVFYSNLFSQGWDGTYKGEIASMDAYAYMVEATDNFGNKLTRKGTVTLLR